MRLLGKRFIVTGAAQGIGFSIAELFSKEGASVAMIDRNAQLLNQAAERLKPNHVFPIVSDVTKELEIGAAVDQACVSLGGCDGVVNSAGVDLLRNFQDIDRSSWDSTLAVNLTGPFLVCHAALPALKKAGGTIVNISSAAGLRPLPDRTAYCAAKAGLVMFTKALAIDVSKFGIRANVICPGITDTPQFRAEFEFEPDPAEALSSIVEMYQIKRMARPSEIAAVALFLASEESSYITGSAIAADGGRSFH